MPEKCARTADTAMQLSIIYKYKCIPKQETVSIIYPFLIEQAMQGFGRWLAFLDGKCMARGQTCNDGT
jgi:hypothetical protein